MKTKAKATQKYIVDLWSAKHYRTKLNPRTNIFQGIISDIKTKKQYMFGNVVGFLKAIDDMYRKAEGRTSKSSWKVKKGRKNGR